MSWRRILLGLLASLAVWHTATVCAEGHFAQNKSSFHIGIEANRQPYAYMDDKQQAKGFMVAAVKSVCQQLGLDCRFVGGMPAELLQRLRDLKLNAVLVLDTSLPPHSDVLELTHPANMAQLKLTQPFCKPVPVFLHKKGVLDSDKLEDYRGSHIGVQEGSIFHSALLAHYGKVAKIRVYPMLESAIVDLVFGRLDAILGGRAFFKARVFDTMLDEFARLDRSPVVAADLPVSSMALVFRERETELLEQWNAVLMAANSKDRPCLALQEQYPVKPPKTNP